VKQGRRRGGPACIPSPTAPSLPSSLARCARPRVQAKMEAMGLVEVGLPFWNSRQCRVTVPEPAATCASDSAALET
jgi:hypothetical protein